jgi:hypothetical protein
MGSDPDPFINKKNMKKNLDFYYFLFDFLFKKTDVIYLLKVISKKTVTKNFFAGNLSATDEKSRIRILTDLQHWLTAGEGGRMDSGWSTMRRYQKTCDSSINFLLLFVTSLGLVTHVSGQRRLSSSSYTRRWTGTTVLATPFQIFRPAPRENQPMAKMSSKPQ